MRRELLLTLTQSASAPADSDSDSFSFSDDYVDAMEPLGPFVVDVHPDPVFEPLSADHQPLYLTQPPLLINVCVALCILHYMHIVLAVSISAVLLIPLYSIACTVRV